MSRDASASPSPRKAFADRRRDPATKREAVLKTAAQLFLEKSYGRTSMNDVADRLNITKPCFFFFFKKKVFFPLNFFRWGLGFIEEVPKKGAGWGKGQKKFK